jgi:cytoskeletal protein RodZ
MALDPSGHIGDALRMAREARGLSIAQVAESTRVRSGHIAALEAFDLEKLPSRPFAIGYIRAYALALGLDADAVVARFKAEAPEPDSDLHSPIGVRHNMPKRFGSLAAVAVLLCVGVVAWNVARHAMAQPPRARVVANPAAPVITATPPAGPVSLGAPLPAPPEATTPAAYETPGMAAAHAAGGSADAAIAAKAAAGVVKVDDSAQIGRPFVAAGAIYGDAQAASSLILQAEKPTALTVHGKDGSVYFTRFLAAGEAWRAPAVAAGLQVDAANPDAVMVYSAGVAKGHLRQPTTALSAYGG